MHSRSDRRAVAALALAVCFALPAHADEASRFGAWTLHSDHPLFGGLSAIEMSADGSRFVALSDRGAVIEAQVRRNDAGHVSGVDLQSVEELSGRDGLRGPWAARDSEGVAQAHDGTVFLSFEGDHRVVRYLGAGEMDVLPPHPDFADLQENASLEALAVDAEGTLYTIPERSGDLDRPFPIYRYTNGQWDSDLTLRRDGRFLVVGADFDDLGRLYVLERDFSLLFGFSTRIRRFEVTPERLISETIVLATRAGTHSNLEGLSVWRDGQGRLVASMVSDDNFSPLLPTQLVEYLLP